MRKATVLSVVGVALVVLGVLFAERSWGWSYALAAVGLAMIAGGFLVIRGDKRAPHSPS